MFDLRTFIGLAAAFVVAFTLGSPVPASAGGGVNCGFGSFEGSDETIRVFPTYGVISPDGDSVIIPLRAWVYEHEEDRIRRYTIKAFRKSLGIEEDSPEYPIFKRRMLDFMVDNERGFPLRSEGSLRRSGRYSPVLTRTEEHRLTPTRLHPWPRACRICR